MTDRGDPDNCGATSQTCAAPQTSGPATLAITALPIDVVSVTLDVSPPVTDSSMSVDGAHYDNSHLPLPFDW